MDNYFQNISQKISGSQEDNHFLNFGCPRSFSGRRGHEDTRTLPPWCGQGRYWVGPALSEERGASVCPS